MEKSLKFFTKYLPVEGEIKGWCRYKPTGEIFYQQFGNNAMWDKPDGKLQHITSGLIAYEKVKLFLCSRDIQVGDYVEADYWIDKGGKWESHFMKRGEVIGYNEKMEHWILKRPDDLFIGRFVQEYSLKSGTFKVIGEISSEATWVREGMEFDKDEIKAKYNDGMSTLDISDDSPFEYTLLYYKIKGPCGHFH